MILPQLSPSVGQALRPRPFVPTPEWAPANITLPKNSEIRGKFRLDLFPHAREPLECFDDPDIRTITLQWASRLGKTVVVQTCLAKVAETNPHPQAFADADEKSVKRVLKRLWKILEKVPGLQEQLPPRRLRSSELIELRDSVIHGCWSGSPATAADFAALVVALNEIDKMSKRVSDEADFAFLMEERCKGYPRSKVLRVSTPSIKGQSRVEAFRVAGDNRARLVPCPKCNHWQMLQTGDQQSPGGLKWETDSKGRSTPDVALETAWYECEKCLRKIRNEERYALLNAGRWVPEGQTISGSGKLTGKPARPGPDASFGPLGTHHSLLPSITWGKIAKAYLDSGGSIEKRRNYINSWEGKTWDPAPPAGTWQELAARLCDATVLRGVVPTWGRFVTVGVDVQKRGLPWLAVAWGLNARCAVIDWGVSAWGPADADPAKADELRHLKAEALHRDYQHADGGPPLRPVYSLIDSGDDTPRVYALCNQLVAVDPCKGSSHEFNEHFRMGERGDKKRAGPKRKSMRLPIGRGFVEINTRRTQRWVEDNLVRAIEPGMHGCLWFAAAAGFEPDLLEEFLNECRVEGVNEHGEKTERWVRRDTHKPNDRRDCLRMAWTAAQVLTQYGRMWTTLPERQTAPRNPSQAPSAFTTPDGRPFLITDR